MKEKLLLDYLYSCNNIPVWLLGEDALPFYYNEKRALRDKADVCAFFQSFISKAGETPLLYSINNTELYAFFKYDKATALIGPAFMINPMRNGRAKQHLSVDYLYTLDAAKEKILMTPSVNIDEFISFVCVAIYILKGKQYDPKALSRNLNKASMQSIFNKTLTGRIFNIREEIELPSHDYEMEQRYLRNVREGDYEKLQNVPKLTVFPVKTELSNDPIKQFLYEMIALATLTTRAAIEGGLDIETAYTMSDLYIRQMDGAKTAREILSLSQSMVYDFALKVKEQKLNSSALCNRCIQSCIEYIRANLHVPISLQALSKHVSMNDKYLSRLFIKETGMSLTEFVQKERIIEAKSLLEYSDYSLLDISNYLAFSSQSYFIKVFKKHTGLTPNQYRNNTQN